MRTEGKGDRINSSSRLSYGNESFHPCSQSSYQFLFVQIAPGLREKTSFVVSPSANRLACPCQKHPIAARAWRKPIGDSAIPVQESFAADHLVETEPTDKSTWGIALNGESGLCQQTGDR